MRTCHVLIILLAIFSLAYVSASKDHSNGRSDPSEPKPKPSIPQPQQLDKSSLTRNREFWLKTLTSHDFTLLTAGTLLQATAMHSAIEQSNPATLLEFNAIAVHNVLIITLENLFLNQRGRPLSKLIYASQLFLLLFLSMQAFSPTGEETAWVISIMWLNHILGFILTVWNLAASHRGS